MKTAVITGATKGMGKSIAEKFLEKGFQIAICARSDEALYKVKKNWQETYLHQDILACPVDLRDKKATLNFAEKIKSHFGQAPDVLVNNAGLFEPGNLADEPDGKLESMMQLNLYSAYYLTRSLLPGMLERSRGHIFNMCSVASLKAYPNGGSYSITKFALRGFTENLRYELQNKGIKVTAITPGAVWTDSWKESGVPENRMMTTKDIAELVWTAYNLSTQATVENIILRPLLGDI